MTMLASLALISQQPTFDEGNTNDTMLEGAEKTRGFEAIQLLCEQPGYQNQPPCQTKINASKATAVDLPFEILRAIFLLATPLAKSPASSTFQNKYLRNPLQSRQPLSFTYVCSWWRSVALGTPELWSSLDATHEWAGSMTRGAVKIWLENAKTSFNNREGNADVDGPPLARVHALNLHLAPSSTSDPRMTRYNIRTMQLFWDHLPRCRSINLRLDKEMLRHFAATYVFDAPLLEDVEISSQTVVGKLKCIKPIASWLERLPALRRLALTLPYNRQQRTELEPMHFERLEEVVLNVDQSFASTIRSITSCTSATKIRFNDLTWLSPPRVWVSVNIPFIRNPITLSNLTSLILVGKHYPFILLDCIVTPALKVLELNSSYPDYRPSAFGDFFERSGCRLDKLIIHNTSSTLLQAFNFIRKQVAVRPPALVDIYFMWPSQSHLNFAHPISLAVALGSFVTEEQNKLKTLVALRRKGEDNVAYHIGWGMDIGPKEKVVYEHPSPTRHSG